MSKFNKNDSVSISFHYIQCDEKDDDGDDIVITAAQFKSVCDGLGKLTRENMRDFEAVEALKLHRRVIINNIETINEKTFAGTFENAYWGHEFRNSDKGKIAANSLNYRPFFFILYLSESGKIYIGVQYLGNYGGYTAFKNTVLSLLKDKKVSSHSFNMFLDKFENVVPTEVIFDVSKKSTSITGKNVFSQGVAVALKDKDKSGQYQRSVQKEILSLFKKPPEKIREGLAEFLKEKDLISIKDDELENCRVIAMFNKKKIIIHMLDGSNRATRYPLDVPLNGNGHPAYEDVKTSAIKVLKENFISRKEDV